MRWEDIPFSTKSRCEKIHGIDRPAKPLSYGSERQAYAEKISRLEPYGLILQRYANPHFASIGGFDARRPISGGLWQVTVWGEKFVSDTIEELFLQVVEKFDRDRARQIPKPMIPNEHSVSFPSSRNRLGTFPDSDHAHGPIIRSNKYQLPSEAFYGRL